MNWLLLIIVLYMILSMVNGYRKGLIKTVFSLLAMAIALIAASVGSPIVSRALEQNKGVYDYIDQKVSDVLDIDSEVSGSSEQAAYINTLPLPENIKTQLKVNNNSEIKNVLKVSTFDSYITGYVTRLIINAISYIIVFIIALLLVRVIASLLDIISRLPVLRSLNKMGGLIVGAVKSLLVVWIFFVLVTVFSGSEFGQSIFKMINDSALLSFIYSRNLLMDIVLGVSNTLF